MDMADQPRLFRQATEAINIVAYHRGHEQWFTCVSSRRGGERWSEADQGAYSYLSTEELYDTLCAELAVRLGL